MEEIVATDIAASMYMEIEKTPTAFDKEKALKEIKTLAAGIILNTDIRDYYAEGYVRAAKDIIEIIEKGGIE